MVIARWVHVSYWLCKLIRLSSAQHTRCIETWTEEVYLSMYVSSAFIDLDCNFFFLMNQNEPRPNLWQARKLMTMSAETLFCSLFLVTFLSRFFRFAFLQSRRKVLTELIKSLKSTHAWNITLHLSIDLLVCKSVRPQTAEVEVHSLACSLATTRNHSERWSVQMRNAAGEGFEIKRCSRSINKCKKLCTVKERKHTVAERQKTDLPVS